MSQNIAPLNCNVQCGLFAGLDFSVKGDERTSRKFRATLYKLSRATVKTERVEFANLLRGIAALSVVLSHYLGGGTITTIYC